MATIFNELSYAEKILKTGFSNNVTGKDLRILIKYYRYIGVEEENLYNTVVEFLEKKHPSFSEPIYQEMIYKIINTSKNDSLRIAKPVPVRKNEMDKIREINNFKLEKLLFTMLVVAKYYHITKNGYDEIESHEGNYFLNVKDSMILRMAKISKKKEDNLFHELLTMGYIGRYKGKKLDDGADILFFDKEDASEIVFYVEDLNNVWKYYKPHCEKCGVEIEKTGRNHKICVDCWLENK